MSIRVLGYVATMSKINVEYVTAVEYTRVLKNKTFAQVALQHNQGGGDTCRKGINKHGIKYDSCLYVQKVLANLNE